MEEVDSCHLQALASHVPMLQVVILCLYDLEPLKLTGGYDGGVSHPLQSCLDNDDSRSELLLVQSCLSFHASITSSSVSPSGPVAPQLSHSTHALQWSWAG